MTEHSTDRPTDTACTHASATSTDRNDGRLNARTVLHSASALAAPALAPGGSVAAGDGGSVGVGPGSDLRALQGLLAVWRLYWPGSAGGWRAVLDDAGWRVVDGVWREPDERRELELWRQVFGPETLAQLDHLAGCMYCTPICGHEEDRCTDYDELSTLVKEGGGDG